MRLFLMLILAIVGLMPVSGARAGELVVIELFTSQGCSSCPPADELLGELAAREDVIALSLHVNYWDYIGWADTFATEEFTQRQHDYGRAAGSTVIYTPQMIIGGVDHVIGYRPMNVAELIMDHSRQPYPVEISVTLEGDEYIVQAQTDMVSPRPNMMVQLISYSPLEEVDIHRGENAGHVIIYHNVVTSWQVIGEWNGAGVFQTRVRPEGDGNVAMIIQTSGFGAILGAVRLD
ncbi:DUF1223 domain-containing protein [Rhodophyticola sp. CCM32]|uniref:DUF1223 domain-containing protein n=1 Tax=Rhodophyticola sp. CCM32 TaxID=2916397 RepID=UPI00107EEAA3|nr:DUF1223 domain-containing protein [Rhodophyticola sp. CCM32]QBY00051.1 DUF1223 domain-containing protein [Rhodophyticola sp. CCM32]